LKVELNFTELVEATLQREVAKKWTDLDIKVELKRVLTKKEYKLLLSLFNNIPEAEIMDSLSISEERLQKMVKSYRKKIFETF
jgi:FixJ family two-component response regulator